MSNAATRDVFSGLDPEWQTAFAWLEGELDGRIVEVRRQPRWRPAWFLELEREGERRSLYWRGQRAEIPNGLEQLEREANVMRAMEREGIPVPHVHAFSREPGGIVMDCLPGQANLATAASDAQRSAVINDYMDVLARLHAVPAERFEDLGLAMPEGEEGLALGDLDDWIRNYRRDKSRPEPEVEFLIAWLLRNVPKGRTKRSLLCADAGQFMFEGDRITGLIDLELAYIGDPAADLGSLRCRDLSEPLGPIGPAIEYYENKVGERIDRSVIDYHTVRFSTCTPMIVAPMLARHIPTLDYTQYLVWYLVYAKGPLEVIADGMGLALEPVETIEPTDTRFSAAADALVGKLAPRGEAMSTTERSLSGDQAGYERDSAWRLAQVLERVDRLGPAIDAANLDDIAAAYGKRPTTADEGAAFLEERIAASTAEDDAVLVPLLHRRLQRLEWIAAPAMREYEGVRMQRIE